MKKKYPSFPLATHEDGGTDAPDLQAFFRAPAALWWRCAAFMARAFCWELVIVPKDLAEFTFRWSHIHDIITCETVAKESRDIF